MPKTHPRNERRIGPQPGPQTAFLQTSADIAIFGGAAGGGKSYALLLDALRHRNTPGAGTVIFRRTTPEICNTGGLWEKSEEIYPLLGAVGSRFRLCWTFPSGMTVRFAHMEHEKHKYSWQGSEVPVIGFDELTHFTESQFFYMMTRNRSMCGVNPYIRATCNPDPDSFVARLVEWWIDQNTGHAIPARSGVVRWFTRYNDNLIFADTKAEIEAEHGPHSASSLTFIPSFVFDNPILLEKQPDYIAKLRSASLVERERLLGGNWKIRPAAGNYFKREWFKIVDEAPAGGLDIRYWDRAATEKRADNDPDWTVGLRLRRVNGMFYVINVVRDQRCPVDVKRMILNTAAQDGRGVRVGIEQDPGQAGVAEAQDQVRSLAGYPVRLYLPSGDKETRATPASAQAGAGNIVLVKGPWNRAFLDELEGFPEAAHDDQVDALSGAFNALTAGNTKIFVA